MDQPKWLKLSAVGLVIVLAGVAYFLVIGRNSQNKNQTETLGTVEMASPSPLSVVSPTPVYSPSPQSAYNTVMDRRNLANASTLPSTGFPTDLIGIFSVAVVVVGFGLRKFPQ